MVVNDLFLANLPFAATEDEIREFVRVKGGFSVSRVRMSRDFESQRFRGFAFVTVMVADEETLNAKIAGLFGQELGGRAIHVEVAKGQRRVGRPAED